MIRWPIVVLSALAAVLLFAGVFDAAKSAGACANPNHLYNEGLLANARKAYVDLLDDDATAKCAKNGLRNVAAARCEAAQSLGGAGRTKEAETEYLAIASGEPGGKLATCALTALHPNTCTLADTLTARGLLSEARKSYVALLQDPAADAGTVRCAEQGLDAVAVAQCAHAASLLAAGRTADAQRIYAAIATQEPIPPAARCARSALEALAAKPSQGAAQ
jgi:hypothetical protein